MGKAEEDDSPQKPARSRAGTTTKVAKKDKFDALIIVIDCGANMKRVEPNGATSFSCATEAVDWILSRKIFTQAKDRINIILFGTDTSNNSLDVKGVDVKDECLVPVEFDHIKYLQNEVVITKNIGNLTDALMVAVDTMKRQIEGDAAIENKSILFITNAEVPPKGSNQLEHIARGVQALGVNFVAMGVDDALISDNPNCASLLSDFVESVDGDIMSFSDASSALHSFSHKQVTGRAIRKNWEVAAGVFLPLSMYVRSMTAKNPLKSVFVNEKGEEMKREQHYFVKTDLSDEKQAKKNTDDNEFMEVEDTANYKKVEKEDLVYGFLFGKSKVVLTEEDMADFKDHNFNEGETGGCMKLIQFTKRQNISPSYFIGNSSLTIVPGIGQRYRNKDVKLVRVTLSLIEGMLKDDVVAICRYAYNASFHIQLMALIPRRDEETGQLYMTGLRLPFMDDWRPFALPDISLRGAEPNSTQLDLVDDLINIMDLSKTKLSYDGVLNPFFQRQCTMMKIKAMNKLGAGDDDTLIRNLAPSIFLKRNLEPHSSFTESSEFKKISGALPEIFNLEEVVRVKRTRAEIQAELKDHLKGYDMADEEIEEMKPELPDPEGPQKKFWMKVRKALEDDGPTINTWLKNVASDMSLFSGDSMEAVDRYKILRMEMLAAQRAADFNSWMMSLHGNDEYSDFFQFMDGNSEPALITNSESADSWYSTVDAEMFWAGMLDDEKK